MAVLSSRRRPEPEPPARRRALVAAASQIPLDGTGWKNFKLGDTEWQKEGWKHYDICGELRFVADFVGKSISRCRLYVAELDELGKAGAEVTDENIAILSETVFGGPANKAEAQRLLGIHLFVPGESYIVAESVENANDDRWYVVSTSGVKRQGDRDIMVERPQEYGGGWYTLKEGKDLLIRAWTPHPRKYDLADSSVRPALPILREIEQLTKHVFAQIDSRLAGAGLLLLPDQLDFPRGEEDPPGAAGLMAVLQRAMAASLSDRSDPSSLVPIMAQVPGEFIDKIRHITFETPLAKEGMDIRDRALRRLGLSLDIDPEILLGKGDTNHWSAWQLEESTIKVHIEPILARICDALTTGYLRAALTAMGKDPEQYTFWYDTSPLAVRPNRQEDGLTLFEQDAISEEALRQSGAWSEDDAPDDEERARRLATKLVLIDPTLIHQEAIQKALGVAWKLEAPEPPAAIAPPPGQEPEPEEKPKERALPQKAKEEPTAAQAALLMGAHMVVQRSLEMAGKRLLTRANRDKFRDVPPWELHTVIHVLEADHAERLLDDTFGAVTMLAERTGVPAGELRQALAGYCRELFVRAVPHDIDTLEQYLGWCMGAATTDEVDAWLGRFHLPGRHDQTNHGRRKSRPDFQPFTERQKRTRMLHRRTGGDPDRNASGPARQGRPAMAMWEAYARQLGTRPTLNDEQRQALQRASEFAAAMEADMRSLHRERAEAGTNRNVALADPVKKKKIPEDMDVQADLRNAILNQTDAQARIEKAMRAAYEIEDAETGIKVHVAGVAFTRGSGARMSLELRDKDGRMVGTCTRRWMVKNVGEPGNLTDFREGIRVEHAYLQLTGRVRGGGFAKRFNANAEEVYKEAGVDAIEIHANIDVGGYAWAKQGYLFQNFEQGNHLMRQVKGRAAAMLTDPAEQAAWRKLVGKFTEENFSAGKAPTPMDIAMFGWKPGADTWAGKRLLLNSDWYGLKPMNQEALSLAAAATSSPADVMRYSEELDLWHDVWTNEYAEEVPFNEDDKHPNAEGQSDYAEHHHDISCSTEEDDVFWFGAMVLATGGSLLEDEGLTADAAWDEDDPAAFHLPGRHDQTNHGRRKGRPDFQPFTPREKVKRKALRDVKVDPDRDASAPARQGRRSMADWEKEAKRLTAEAGGRPLPALPESTQPAQPAAPKARRTGKATPDQYPAPVKGKDISIEPEFYDLFDQNPSPLSGDTWQPYDIGIQHVGRMQGFDAPATTVTKEEMDQLVAGGALELHRGVKPPRAAELTTEEVLDTVRDKEYQPGSGIYGNGWYFSVNQRTADEFGGSNGRRIRVALKPNLKTIDYDEARKLMQRERIEGLESGMHPEFLNGWGRDVGRWAVSKGYDAFTVNGPESNCAKKQNWRPRSSSRLDAGDCHGDGTEYSRDPNNSGYEQQVVILNRSALFIEAGSHKTTGGF